MTKTQTLRPSWNPLNIALMVLGFVLFWPLGLAMLAYILWGDRLPAFVDDMKANFRGATRPVCGRAPFAGTTGNAAFDDYRSRELKRLEEERRRLEGERRAFDDYVQNLRRARDQEEFDRFMAERRAKEAN